MAVLTVMTGRPEIGRALSGFLKTAGVEGVDIRTALPADLILADDMAGIRLGALVDWLIARRDVLRLVRPEKLFFSTGTLQVGAGVFIPSFPGGTAQRLTGREVDLMLALAAAPDGRMAKADLLSYVWGYVPGVETHTLETHIYRLRQKIESDPSTPAVLLTEEGAYRIQKTES